MESTTFSWSGAQGGVQVTEPSAAPATSAWESNSVIGGKSSVGSVVSSTAAEMSIGTELTVCSIDLSGSSISWGNYLIEGNVGLLTDASDASSSDLWLQWAEVAIYEITNGTSSVKKASTTTRFQSLNTQVFGALLKSSLFPYRLSSRGDVVLEIRVTAGWQEGPTTLGENTETVFIDTTRTQGLIQCTRLV